MPKGYMIFTEDIRDDAGMNIYTQQAIPTITQAGGRVIVADDVPELIEGSWHGKRTVALGLTPWRPRGTGTGRLNIRGSWVSAMLPLTATQ